MLKKLITGGAVLASGAAIWGVAGQDHTTRDTSGSIVQSGQLGVFVTHVGDCFASLPGSDANGFSKVSTVDAVPCNGSHHWQVFFKGELVQDNYDAAAVETGATNICSDAITNLSNSLSADMVSEYQNATSKVLYPTTESFAKGDRKVDCILGNASEIYTDSLI